MFRNFYEPKSRLRYCASFGLLLFGLLPVAYGQELDETWTVSVNGQTVQVDADGSFVISNVAAPDLFGIDGPGSAPDFLSDNFLVLTGFSTATGTTRWVFSPLFQITQGESFSIGELTITDSPPQFPDSIRAVADPIEILVGGESQLLVTGTLVDGTEIDVTTRATGTVYVPTNSDIVTVAEDGLASAHSRGTVFITSRNVNATAVTRIDVISESVDTTVEGFVQFQDQSPVVNAQVTLAVIGGSGSTNAEGFFAIPASVAVELPIDLAVVAQSGGQTFTGSAGGVPVFADGISDAGIIILEAGPIGEIPVILFDNPEYDVGFFPTAVAIGDLNGDGSPDAVVANSLDDTVSVLLSAGSPVFAEQTTYNVADSPIGVVIGDLDNDGDADLAVASGGCCNAAPGEVTILLNNGNGTFADAPSTFSLAQGAVAIVIADLDGDNDLDLATANRAGTISVLINNGDATFADQIAFVIGGDTLRSLAVGDLDGDGDLDLATCFYSLSTVSILYNTGDGLFADQLDLIMVDIPVDVEIGEFNGDDVLDIAVANLSSDGHIDLLVGKSDGGFLDSVSLEAGLGSVELAVGDIDGDQDLDLAKSGGAFQAVSILLNNGDGSFASAVSVPAGAEPRSLALADLDGDSDLDIAVVDLGQNQTLSLILNNGDGTFGPPRYDTGATPCEGVAIAIADFDGGGVPDLAIAGCGEDRVSVLLGKGDGTFADFITFSVPLSVLAMTSDDIDQDGNHDLIFAGDSAVSILLNDGNGGFGGGLNATVGNQPRSVAVGHLDGDNFLDVVTCTFDGNTVSVLFGNGDGTFASALTLSVTEAWRVELADVNGDGQSDIVVAKFLSFLTPIAIFLSNGDGTFADVLELSTQDFIFPFRMAVGDSDDDGDVDIIVTNGGNNVWSFAGNGDATFDEPHLIELDGNMCIESVVLADLYGDGRPSILTVNRCGKSIAVLSDGQDGVLELDRFYAAGFRPASLAAGDLDGDGDVDLAVAAKEDSSVTILLNRTVP